MPPSKRGSATSPDNKVQQLFETVTRDGEELKGVQTMQLQTSKFHAPQDTPERLKDLLLPGVSPMAMQTAKDRLAKPDEPVKPNFDGLKKWYDDQLPKEALFSQSDWKEARKYVQERVTSRREQSVEIRDGSVNLRTTGDKKLKKKSIEVKNNFITRIEEIEGKAHKLKALKKQVDTETLLLQGAIKSLDEFNSTRFAWPAKANEQCLQLRAKRIGIDLVADDVDFQLKRERDMLEHVSEDLERAFNSAVDHMTMMQDCGRQLGEDIARKNEAGKTEIKLEKLKVDNDRNQLHVATLQAPPKNSRMYLEWLSQTDGLEQASKELIQASKKMRKTMGKMENETDDKVKLHENDTGVALRKRTGEYQEAIDENRILLNQVKHEVATVLTELKSCCAMVDAQEQPMKRTTTRLKKRETGRSEEERTIDAVHEILIQEASDLNVTVQTLQMEIGTHNANLEELRSMEGMLEEDLAIKQNSLKIENKCTYARSYFCKHKAEKKSADAAR